MKPCSVAGCQRICRNEILMCARCWRATGDKLKRTVNATWRAYETAVNAMAPREQIMATRRDYLKAREAALNAAGEALCKAAGARP